MERLNVSRVISYGSDTAYSVKSKHTVGISEVV